MPSSQLIYVLWRQIQRAVILKDLIGTSEVKLYFFSYILNGPLCQIE